MSSSFQYRNKLPTLQSACEEEGNFLLRVEHQRAAENWTRQLWDQRGSIVDLITEQLSLSKDDACKVLLPQYWPEGKFNVCVLVEVTRQDTTTEKFVFRCPMRHMHAEDQYPGTIDEKMSCEAASYVWMQENCAEIRIPHLYAFGFADGGHFTHTKHMPFYQRIYHNFRRWIYRSLGLPLLSNYIRNLSAPDVGTAYSILEYIGPDMGQMLSITWERHKDDAARQSRLYRGLAHIMLSLARIPQPSIGAYRFDTVNSTITLTNRPLTCSAMVMENSGTPRSIQPRQTYQSVESFTSDMLTMYDEHLLHHPHAVQDEDDARERFTIRMLHRAVSHHFIRRCWRNGPFLLQPTDLHQSNIFVDDAWNVTGMIDLEWMCSLPVDMLSVPHWLTDCNVFDITNEEYDRFDRAREQFLTAMDKEAETMMMEHDIPITQNMRDTWLSKGAWFWACISSLDGWLWIFEDHILTKFSTDKKLVASLKQASALWQQDVESVIKRKVEDGEEYRGKLEALLSSLLRSQ
ncbi:hypothetical protein AK830_g6701 [Neonectria ditissima]|uniref:Aminoglycoside phosphotransferase domain-containing protein n=1 Tax=Neonectria ditissima TaxID=78410 RepID=A0A0P7BFU3_9HYPO|nr:hypothetical protein AK830_g6701 [Neonectria ditissima]